MPKAKHTVLDDCHYLEQHYFIAGRVAGLEFAVRYGPAKLSQRRVQVVGGRRDDPAREELVQRRK